MTFLNSPHFLRLVLAADAATCLAMGLGLVSVPAMLSGLSGFPAAFLSDVGIILLGFGAFIAFVASRQEPPQSMVWVIIIGNLIWVADSALLLLSGWYAPTGTGTAFVIVQAVAGLAIADLEYIALRRHQTRLLAA